MTREPDELLALCRAARCGEAPSAEDRRAIRGRLITKGLISATASSLVVETAVATARASSASNMAGAGSSVMATAGGVKSSLAAVALYVAGAVASGVALTASVRALDTDPPPATSAPVAQRGKTANRQRTAPVATTSSLPVTPQSALVDLRPSPPVTTPPRASGRRPPTRVSSTPAKRVSSLGEEAAGLAEVQRSLRDGNAPRALAVLNALDQQLATGSLTVERKAARILALCAAGRLDEARAQRLQFLADHESSPLASRVRASCPND